MKAKKRKKKKIPIEIRYLAEELSWIMTDALDLGTDSCWKGIWKKARQKIEKDTAKSLDHFFRVNNIYEQIGKV